MFQLSHHCKDCDMIVVTALAFYYQLETRTELPINTTNLAAVIKEQALYMPTIRPKTTL